MAYDLFFLSYNEPFAGRHLHRVRKIAPHAAHVNGVKGILNAHQECARRAKTSHFFVVDADSWVLDFDFRKFKLPAWDEQFVHLWYARNPVNGLEYGWGGIKLFPKKTVLNADGFVTDMTTSFELKVVPEVKSITYFNSSPYEAWRSAFREAFKLARGSIKNSVEEENKARLKIWKTVGANQTYGRETMLGAADGEEFALTSSATSEINDWEWLRSYYEKKYL